MTTTSVLLSHITKEVLSQYFKSPLVNPSKIRDTFPLFAHKDFVNTHLAQGFLSNPKVIIALKLSLLKLAKSIDPSIVSLIIKVIYNQTTLLLGDLGFTY